MGDDPDDVTYYDQDEKSLSYLNNCNEIINYKLDLQMLQQ